MFKPLCSCLKCNSFQIKYVACTHYRQRCVICILHLQLSGKQNITHGLKCFPLLMKEKKRGKCCHHAALKGLSSLFCSMGWILCVFSSVSTFPPLDFPAVLTGGARGRWMMTVVVWTPTCFGVVLLLLCSCFGAMLCFFVFFNFVYCSNAKLLIFTTIHLNLERGRLWKKINGEKAAKGEDLHSYYK